MAKFYVESFYPYESCGGVDDLSKPYNTIRGAYENYVSQLAKGMYASIIKVSDNVFSAFDIQEYELANLLKRTVFNLNPQQLTIHNRYHRYFVKKYKWYGSLGWYKLDTTGELEPSKYVRIGDEPFYSTSMGNIPIDLLLEMSHAINCNQRAVVQVNCPFLDYCEAEYKDNE